MRFWSRPGSELKGVENSPVTSVMPQSFSGVVISGWVVIMVRATVRPSEVVPVVPASTSCWVRASMSMPSPGDGATYCGLAPAAPSAEPSMVQPAFVGAVSIAPMASMMVS